MFSILQVGRSTLHVAVESGQTEVVKILVTHGAHVDAKDGVRTL